MMQRGCAACHGVDGTGRSTAVFEAPNITYANLTAAAGMREPSGERGPTYTDAQFCRAVVRGVDPSGDSLNQWMPRWHLDSGECVALIAYLKSLR